MAEKQTLEDLLNNDSFVRWISNKSNEKEQDYWQTWLRQDPTRKELVEQARELTEVVELDAPIISEPQKELKKLMGTLDKKEARPGTGPRFHRRINRRSKAFWGSAAAGLLLLIAVMGFWVNEYYKAPSPEESTVTQKKQEYKTGYGEKTHLSLSDGSKIILNANSHLKYLTSTGQRQDIEVWLKGEAYFDIFHHEGNNQRSFTVHTSDGSVEVLGTQFVVKTATEGTQAVLQKGKIRIKADSSRSIKRRDKEVVMAPGELAHFSSELGKIVRSKVNTRVYTSWIEDTWVFDETPLRQVADRIEDTFGVKVEIAGTLQKKILSGSIKSTNLDFLQKALSEVVNEPVTKRGNTVLIGEK